MAGAILAPMAAGVLWYSHKDKSGRWRLVGHRLLFWAVGSAIGSTICLVGALLARDFSIHYVVRYTSRLLSPAYAVTSLWAGNDGSLLFWSSIICIYILWVFYGTRKEPGPLVPTALGVLATVLTFFLWLILFRANPWRVLSIPAAEGMGLNPQLQNAAMMYHPPTLYMGYVGMAVPFAFAISALIHRRLDARWIQVTRSWTLTAWFFLAAGNLMGAWWAYDTLGWGGYWAWDPVENAAFLPLLTSTAFLHSVMMQEKKGMLKVWNLVLVITTFSLTIFGTFLTRSGIISSVHSFAKDPGFGMFFLGFLAVVFCISLYLILSRLPYLAAEHRLESFLSREASFLFNNLLFLGCAFTVLFGTLYPVLGEMVTGSKVTVGPPFFNAVLAPVFLCLLVLMGICPLIAWRRATPGHFRKSFLIPLSVGAAMGLFLIIFGLRSGLALAFLSACAFVATTLALEYGRGTLARSRMSGEPAFEALIQLVRKNPRRYGGYLIHIAVVFVFMGVTVSSIYPKEKDLVLNMGESQEFEGYEFKFVDLKRYRESTRDVTEAVVSVEKDGKPVGVMRAVKDIYPIEQQVWTRPAIRSGLVHDLYLTLSEFDEDDGSWVALNIRIIPMVAWIWFGGLILVAAGFIYLAPKPSAISRVTKEKVS